jgi:hypothetical protein
LSTKKRSQQPQSEGTTQTYTPPTHTTNSGNRKIVFGFLQTLELKDLQKVSAAFPFNGASTKEYFFIEV